MHYSEIISALHIANSSPSKIAKGYGCSASSVSNVIHGRSTSAPIAKRIASVIKKPTSEIWPDGRYEPRPPRRFQPAVRITA